MRKILVSSLTLITALVPIPSTDAAIYNLFNDRDSCIRTLEAYRLEPGLASWAMNVDCHWHPELGEHGLWYIH